MAKKTSPKNENGAATEQAIVENVITVKTETGAIRKNVDETSDIDWTGKIALSAPGEYWLNGFMRKDNTGVWMELQAKLKESVAANQMVSDRGVLFKNNRKRLLHQPDYTGNITASSPGEFNLSCIIKQSASSTYMEISIENNAIEKVGEDEMPF